MEGTMNEWYEAKTQEELDALLSQHGEWLRVRLIGEWESVDLENSKLRAIDLSGVYVRGPVRAAGASVYGELRAAGVRIGDVPRLIAPLDLCGADIRGDVILDGSHVSDALLADGVRIEGDLSAIGTRVGYSWRLRGARIKGDVYATHARVGGSLLAEHASMRHLTLDYAHFDGHIHLDLAHLKGALTYSNARVGEIEMPYEMHGVQGWAIAQCDGYVLWRDRLDYYRAGCRGPFTAGEALAHWGEHRRDERARVFREALLVRFGRKAVAA
jgi:hypothetical protein